MPRREADAKGAVESQMTDVVHVEPNDVLGYHGTGREEHSGENSPEEENLVEELVQAD